MMSSRACQNSREWSLNRSPGIYPNQVWHSPIPTDWKSESFRFRVQQVAYLQHAHDMGADARSGLRLQPATNRRLIVSTFQCFWDAGQIAGGPVRDAERTLSSRHSSGIRLGVGADIADLFGQEPPSIQMGSPNAYLPNATAYSGFPVAVIQSRTCEVACSSRKSHLARCPKCHTRTGRREK
jgi:hypothetical protein